MKMTIDEIEKIIDTEIFRWRFLQDAKPPSSVKKWMLDDHSLSAKLRARFADFRLHLVCEKITRPKIDELQICGVHSQYVVRKVALIGADEILVFARTVIPKTPDTNKILNLGASPLGEILFADPNISRGEIRIARTGKIWARRSPFKIRETTILVAEFFLPPLYA